MSGFFMPSKPKEFKPLIINFVFKTKLQWKTGQ